MISLATPMLSMLYAVVCPSVCLSVTQVDQLTLSLCNFHRTVAPFLVFVDKIRPEILKGSSRAGIKQRWGG